MFIARHPFGLVQTVHVPFIQTGFGKHCGCRSICSFPLPYFDTFKGGQIELSTLVLLKMNMKPTDLDLRSQLIGICTVCHSVFELVSTIWIK